MIGIDPELFLRLGERRKLHGLDRVRKKRNYAGNFWAIRATKARSDSGSKGLARSQCVKCILPMCDTPIAGLLSSIHLSDT